MDRSPQLTPPWQRHATWLLGLVLPLVVFLANLRPIWDYTVDDAFISFRYARNLSRGDGLVYNLGERVEGYTNFLWTLLLAAAHRIGLPIELSAKMLGATAGAACIVFIYILSRRLLESPWPPLAPLLLATSISMLEFSVSGMETSLFVALLLVFTIQLHQEQRVSSRWPWSGIVLGVACLVRPEAPLFGAILILGFIGLPRTRRDWVRVLLVAVMLGCHLAFRRMYYDAWLPNTFAAKIGYSNPLLTTGRYRRGLTYVGSYLSFHLPIVALGLVGGLLAGFRRLRGLLASTCFAGAMLAYGIFTGGDWMAGWRYLAPVEPFLFLLAGAGFVGLASYRLAAARALIVAMLLSIATWRVTTLRMQQRELVLLHADAWHRLVQPLAEWLATQPRGLVACGDIGRIGWYSDFPLFDWVGLVTKETANIRLSRPGDLAQLQERFEEIRADYVVIQTWGDDCKLPNGRYRYPLDLSKYDTLRLYKHNTVLWCVLGRKQ